MTLIEKLTLKDTFKIWRDKINALIDSMHKQPITDENGNYIINEQYTDANKVLMEIPLEVTTTVTAETFIGELVGNTSTATTLKTPRKINGTIFDGSSDITTSSWGTTKNFKISDYEHKNTSEAVKVGNTTRDEYILTLPSKIKADIDGTTTTANALKKTVQINGIKFNGTDNVINYGICDTSSSEYTKVVTLFSNNITDSFVLTNGSTITVKFNNKNTSTNQLFLKVANTTPALIYAHGAPIDPYIIDAGSVLTFVYDGKHYNLTSLDKRVRQSEFANNGEHPLLASSISDSTTTLKDDYTFFTKGITINPSINSLTIAGAVTSNSLNTQAVTTPSINSLKDLTISASSVSITNDNLNVSGAMTVNGLTTLDTAYVNVLQTKYNNETINIIEKGVVRNAVYNNDYAEFFPRGEETEAGDIIALDETSKIERYVKATDKSKLVVGVHSNTYGYILGGEKSLEESEKTNIPIGLSGRVYVKFKGKSVLGEAVVPSDIPGVGRLYDDFLDSSRKIVGYIVEDNNPSSKEERLVKVLINR